MVARNLKRRKESIEWVKVPGLGNGKAQGLERGGSQSAGKGSLEREVGTAGRAGRGPKVKVLNASSGV